MFKLYEDLKSSERTPTLQEVRMAHGRATPQEVADALRVIQEKTDALLLSLDAVCDSLFIYISLELTGG